MIRIGTRKSKLALIQTELVKTQILKYFPNEKIVNSDLKIFSE